MMGFRGNKLILNTITKRKSQIETWCVFYWYHAIIKCTDFVLICVVQFSAINLRSPILHLTYILGMVLLTTILLFLFNCRIGQSSLQIDCKGHNLSGLKCNDYIATWIRAYYGDTQNSGTYDDLPNIGYSPSIIPYDIDPTSNEAVLYKTTDGTSATIYEYTTLNVGLSIQISNILGIDQDAGTLTLVARLVLHWVDPRLQWNTSLTPLVANGLDEGLPIEVQPTVFLPFTGVWTPDVSLVNGADGSAMEWSPNVQLYASGDIFWFGSGPLKANCALDLTRFPFDEQTCFLQFASKSNFIVLGYNLTWTTSYPGVFNFDYTPSTSFELTSWSYGRKQNILYSFGPTSNLKYSSILYFYLTLKRYPNYYIVTGIVPNIGLTLIAVASLWIPDSATRAAVVVTVLLALIAVGVSTVSVYLSPNSLYIS